MSRNLMMGLIVAVVVVIAGIWLLTRQPAPVPAPAPPATPPVSETVSPSATPSAQVGEMREIKVSGSEFAFSPPTLSVKAGEKVKITFQNNGKFPHNLTIDKLGVATKTIQPGQTDSIEVTADRTGSFVMYCSVDAHRQKGMEGSVQVR